MMRKSSAPAEGWNAASFAERGAKLIEDLVTMARYSRGRREGECQAKVKKMLMEPFQACADLGRMRAKAPTDSEHFWDAVLREVMASYPDTKITTLVAADIQSLVSHGASKTNLALGTPVTADHIASQTPAAAYKVTEHLSGVSNTTRDQIAKIIGDAVQAGMTVDDTAKLILAVGEEMTAFRARGIARTELNNAYT
jgi:hypothetical protein